MMEWKSNSIKYKLKDFTRLKPSGTSCNLNRYEINWAANKRICERRPTVTRNICCILPHANVERYIFIRPGKPAFKKIS